MLLFLLGFIKISQTKLMDSYIEMKDATSEHKRMSETMTLGDSKKNTSHNPVPKSETPKQPPYNPRFVRHRPSSRQAVLLDPQLPHSE